MCTRYDGTDYQYCSSLPFGDNLQCTTTQGGPVTTLDPSAMHFTGKERDVESANDYFGARYDTSGLGRFISPDPTIMIPDVSEPQDWNKYSYTFNRPLDMTDPDGRWPKKYHHQIIDWQYHQYGEHATSILKQASDEVDGMRGQLAQNAPAHHMTSYCEYLRDPVQAQFNAQLEWSHFIYESMRSAAKAQIAHEREGGQGTTDDFWRFYGYALHAEVDATSPEHETMQPWSMVTLIGVGQHVYTEDQDMNCSSPTAMQHRSLANQRSAELWQRIQNLLDQMRQEGEAQTR